jgi:hypothetical protein
MVTIEKDKKGNTYIITRTDAEGFHQQINMTEEDLKDLYVKWFLTRIFRQ